MHNSANGTTLAISCHDHSSLPEAMSPSKHFDEPVVIAVDGKLDMLKMLWSTRSFLWLCCVDLRCYTETAHPIHAMVLRMNHWASQKHIDTELYSNTVGTYSKKRTDTLLRVGHTRTRGKKNVTKVVAHAKRSLGCIYFAAEKERECVVGAISHQGWHARVDKYLRLLKKSEVGFSTVPELSRRAWRDELCCYLLQMTGSAAVSYK